MNKPSEILYSEFTEKIVSAVNTSGLPPFVCALALKDILRDVESLAEQQYHAALAEYEKPDSDPDDMNGGENTDG